MTHVTTWWRGLSERDRFRHYTRLTLQVVVVVLMVVSWLQLDARWEMAWVLVAAAAGVLAFEARPELADWPSERGRRWSAALASIVLLLVAVLNVVAAHRATGDAPSGHRAVTVSVFLVAALAIIPFLPRRWWVLTGAALVTAAALADSPRDAVGLLATTLGVGALICATTLLGLWSLRVVADLERARSAEAELQVAQERLRFARDLHDVVGRGFSTIAVKSELAATLAHAGRAEQAATEMAEVKAFAVDSMEQMRALVRGYREISLDAEWKARPRCSRPRAVG